MFLSLEAFYLPNEKEHRHVSLKEIIEWWEGVANRGIKYLKAEAQDPVEAKNLMAEYELESTSK